MFLKTFSKTKKFEHNWRPCLTLPLLFGVVPFFQRLGRKIGKKTQLIGFFKPKTRKS
jgi:hypothetical protein